MKVLYLIIGVRFDCLPKEIAPNHSPNGYMIQNLFILNLFLVFIIGFFGNILTIMTIINARLNHPDEFHILKHRSTPLLIHLAICDMLYSLGSHCFLSSSLLNLFLHSWSAQFWNNLLHWIFSFSRNSLQAGCNCKVYKFVIQNCFTLF